MALNGGGEDLIGAIEANESVDKKYLTIDRKLPSRKFYKTIFEGVFEDIEVNVIVASSKQEQYTALLKWRRAYNRKHKDDAGYLRIISSSKVVHNNTNYFYLICERYLTNKDSDFFDSLTKDSTISGIEKFKICIGVLKALYDCSQVHKEDPDGFTLFYPCFVLRKEGEKIIGAFKKIPALSNQKDSYVRYDSSKFLIDTLKKVCASSPHPEFDIIINALSLHPWAYKFVLKNHPIFMTREERMMMVVVGRKKTLRYGRTVSNCMKAFITQLHEGIDENRAKDFGIDDNIVNRSGLIKWGEKISKIDGIPGDYTSEKDSDTDKVFTVLLRSFKYRWFETKRQHKFRKGPKEHHEVQDQVQEVREEMGDQRVGGRGGGRKGRGRKGGGRTGPVEQKQTGINKMEGKRALPSPLKCANAFTVLQQEGDDEDAETQTGGKTGGLGVQAQAVEEDKEKRAPDEAKEKAAKENQMFEDPGQMISFVRNVWSHEEDWDLGISMNVFSDKIKEVYPFIFSIYHVTLIVLPAWLR